MLHCPSARTSLKCVGFKPLPSSICAAIVKQSWVCCVFHDCATQAVCTNLKVKSGFKGRGEQCSLKASEEAAYSHWPIPAIAWGYWPKCATVHHCSNSWEYKMGTRSTLDSLLQKELATFPSFRGRVRSLRFAVCCETELP